MPVTPSGSLKDPLKAADLTAKQISKEPVKEKPKQTPKKKV